MPCIGGLTTGVLALGYPEILYQVRAVSVCFVFQLSVCGSASGVLALGYPEILYQVRIGCVQLSNCGSVSRVLALGYPELMYQACIVYRGLSASWDGPAVGCQAGGGLHWAARLVRTSCTCPSGPALLLGFDNVNNTLPFPWAPLPSASVSHLSILPVFLCRALTTSTTSCPPMARTPRAFSSKLWS